MGQNQSQGSKFKIAACLGCLHNDNVDHIFDYELVSDLTKPKGRLTNHSVAYLTNDEINFFKASAGRNVSKIRFYLRKGVNINILDEDRTSPLHVAARHGSIQIVEELLNWGAAVDITDIDGWTPLHVGAFFQRALICHILLKKGADPYIKNRDHQVPVDLVRDKKTLDIFQSHFSSQMKNSKLQLEKQSSGTLCQQIEFWEQQQQQLQQINYNLEQTPPQKQYNNQSHVQSSASSFVQNNQNQSQIMSNNLQNQNQIQNSNSILNQVQGLNDIDNNTDNFTDYVKTISQKEQTLKHVITPQNGRKFINQDFQINQIDQGYNGYNPSYISSQNHQEQQQYLQKKHKYYIYFKNLKKKYALNEEKKNSHIDLDTLYSEQIEEHEPNGIDQIEYQNSQYRCESLCDDVLNVNEEIENKNLSQINFQNYSASKQQQSQKELTAERFDRQKQQILKDFIQTNSSIPFKLQNIYCTPCNAKKNLDFEMVDNAQQPNPQLVSGNQPLISNNPLTNISNTINNNSVNNNSVNNNINSNNVNNNNLKPNSLLDIQQASPSQSICSLFFINKKVISLSQLSVVKPPFTTQQINMLELEQKVWAFFGDIVNSENSVDITDIGNGIFNIEPLLGLAFFQVFGLMNSSGEQVGKFLHGLMLRGQGQVVKSKLAIGRMLTELGVKQINEVVQEYLQKLQFNMNFCSALSLLFSNFVVENNPEKIDILLHYFGKQYFKSQYNKEKSYFSTEDAVHMLAYATAMLDLEVHNNSSKIDLKQVLSEFITNVRGINDGEDFSKDFINSIIEYILMQQIITFVQKQEIDEERQMYIQELSQYLGGKADIQINLVKEGKSSLKNVSFYMLENAKLAIIIQPEATSSMKTKLITLIPSQNVKYEVKSSKLVVRHQSKGQQLYVASSNNLTQGFTVKLSESLKFRINDGGDITKLQKYFNK